MVAPCGAAYPAGVDAADPVSAIIVRVALPAALERIRRLDDHAAADGIPAHVTLLFPFLPVARLEPSIRSDLARIASDVEPFEVRFARVGRFPGAVYLVPEPAAPFAALTRGIAETFPTHPPYGGAFGDVIPHLTLTESGATRLDDIAAMAEPHLPFARRVADIVVIVQKPVERWRAHWRIPLGVRP